MELHRKASMSERNGKFESKDGNRVATTRNSLVSIIQVLSFSQLHKALSPKNFKLGKRQWNKTQQIFKIN